MMKLFSLLSIFLLEIAFSTRCCQYHCDKASCLANAEEGCKWLEPGIDDALIVENIGCRSLRWGDCGDCCPACPETKSDVVEVCESEKICPPIPEEGPSALPQSPESVLELIEEDLAEDCKSNAKNCLDSSTTELYSPNTISFSGVTWDETLDACCYGYLSEYTGTEDCSGKSPEQSHITMDIDCDPSEFEISSGSSSSVSYGTDGSTCYDGIKIDTGCGSVCEYQVCVQFTTLLAGECPITNSWIMDKASNQFSFASLNCIPSCNLPELRKINKKSKEVVDEVHLNANLNSNMKYITYTPAQIIILSLIVMVLCASYFYCRPSNKHKLLDTNTNTASYQSV